MKRRPLSRREMLENLIVRGLLVGGTVAASQNELFAFWQKAEAAANKPTPTEVLGPFYRKGAPNQTVMRIAGEPGFPLRVAGKVCNTRGEKVPGAKVEMWHSDHAGLYDVQGYRYRSRLEVESEYAVETIMPGHYSDRPAQHIHYLISAPGHRTLITQAYFATDPWFEGDPDKNYNKRKLVDNKELVRPVMLYEGPGPARASIQFDICLEKL